MNTPWRPLALQDRVHVATRRVEAAIDENAAHEVGARRVPDHPTRCARHLEARNVPNRSTCSINGAGPGTRRNCLESARALAYRGSSARLERRALHFLSVELFLRACNDRRAQTEAGRRSPTATARVERRPSGRDSEGGRAGDLRENSRVQGRPRAPAPAGATRPTPSAPE